MKLLSPMSPIHSSETRCGSLPWLARSSSRTQGVPLRWGTVELRHPFSRCVRPGVRSKAARGIQIGGVTGDRIALYWRVASRREKLADGLSAGPIATLRHDKLPVLHTLTDASTVTVPHSFASCRSPCPGVDSAKTSVIGFGPLSPWLAMVNSTSRQNNRGVSERLLARYGAADAKSGTLLWARTRGVRLEQQEARGHASSPVGFAPVRVESTRPRSPSRPPIDTHHGSGRGQCLLLPVGFFRPDGDRARTAGWTPVYAELGEPYAELGEPYAKLGESVPVPSLRINKKWRGATLAGRPHSAADCWVRSVSHRICGAARTRQRDAVPLDSRSLTSGRHALRSE
jgi:hypothetical protein